MSGLEVLGAITGELGALPVAVEALKTYKSILSSIRNAARDLACLIRDLETERVRLQTTCEVLLEGIAPFSMIDGMVKDPFGAAWEQYSHLLRLRLWESEREFKNHTLDMSSAATELKRKLCIYGDGSSKPADKVSIIRELKKGASFTLNKKDYIGIVSRIKRGNQALSELARNNRGLESTRRKRSQARLIKLVRGLSDGIYDAIQNSTTCACAASHRVCLELVARDATLTPNDRDDDVARSFKFHVAFDYYNNMGNMGNNRKDRQRRYVNGRLRNRWSNIYFQLGGFGNTGTSIIAPSPAATNSEPSKQSWLPQFLSRHRKDRTLSTIAHVVKEAGIQAAIPSMSVSSQPVSDLCQMLAGKNKQPAMHYFGYITNTDQNFDIHSPTLQLDRYAILTLREILEGGPLKFARFDYPEKLKVAYAITVNTLHLHSTKWMEESLNLDNIIFFLGNNGKDIYNFNTISLDRPFVIKHPLTPRRKKSTTLNAPRPVNLAIFSLGALLIQVMTGKVVSALEMEGVIDVRTIISKRNAGKRLFDQLLESGGINYKMAVEWCFDRVFHVAGLGNEKCCQEFFQEVVARLEEDVQLLSENEFS